MDLKRLDSFQVAACDVNGQMRGKRVTGSAATKLDKGAVRMPLSVLNIDLWGADIDGSPLVFETGDADGILLPTDRGAVPTPWLNRPSALVPMEMFDEDGTPFAGDPRHALKSVLDKLAARGISVLAATEMEFTLIDAGGDAPRPPLNPMTGRRLASEEIQSVAQLDSFDAFLTDVFAACSDMDIPIQSAITESGIGQFEVTLNHQPALRAADDAWLFKTLLRNMARKHGFAGSFMAKPYLDDAGNGMHVHASFTDAKGVNLFDNGGPEGTGLLGQAIAGALAAMPASTLIFAPHANSYERFTEGAHAPTTAAWGYENRTVALRVPGGSPAARRMEHRVAGGDTNPYLILTAILGAALAGIEDDAQPPAPVVGNAYDQDLPSLAHDWASAIERFAVDPMMARLFGPLLVDNLVRTKRQELLKTSKIASEARWKSTFERV